VISNEPAGATAAIILAAGFGTRLAPLTDTTPKPLLTVGHQPVINYLLDRLVELGDITNVVVVVNDQHPGQWSTWKQGLPHELSVTVLPNGVRTQAERAGAVADLALAVSELGKPDHILVLAGDNLLDEPLVPHLRAAASSGHPVVLCRDLGDDVPPGRFGEITTDDNGIISRFREKPAHPESPLAATCSYVLPGTIGTELDAYLASGDADSPGAFIAWVAARQPVLARPLTGRYFDIGNLETLAQARAGW